ncbi:serine/threonine-protein phosphatase 2A regulatory subunit B' [Nematocida ausubeli]|nr:serine/threonine-protein phosphatase 2A regulatory subunit B' [Nematocida ausubeli]
MDLNLRIPPRMQTVLDAETDSGVFLEDWPSIEDSLQSVLDNMHKVDFTARAVGMIIRGILSPDPRERKTYFEIAKSIAERRVLDRSYLINILVEYIVDEIPHYGIELILMLLNKVGDIESEEIVEIYIPLLTKPLNIKIRKEIIYGITTVYIYTTMDIILSSILKHCKQFDSMNSFIAVVIIEMCIDGVQIVSKESCSMLASIFSILLEKELQATVKKITELFNDSAFIYKISRNSDVIVEGLFDTVYQLSQQYWKTTEQSFVCEMLQCLFHMNNRVFDESLRKYNHIKYTKHLEMPKK